MKGRSKFYIIILLYLGLTKQQDAVATCWVDLFNNEGIVLDGFCNAEADTIFYPQIEDYCADDPRSVLGFCTANDCSGLTNQCLCLSECITAFDGEANRCGSDYNYYENANEDQAEFCLQACSGVNSETTGYTAGADGFLSLIYCSDFNGTGTECQSQNECLMDCQSNDTLFSSTNEGFCLNDNGTFRIFESRTEVCTCL